MNLIFIILRYVNSKDHDKLWKNCYNSIRKFYDNKIIICDNYSNKEFLDNNFKVINCEIIENNLNNNLRLFLPFYELLKLSFDRAVIIHDGTHFQQWVDFTLFNNVKYLWHFDTKVYDNHKLINKQITALTNNNELFKYRNKNWKGCLGASLAITKKFLLQIENKYKLSNLAHIINTKEHAIAFERTISIICSELYPNIKYDISFEGEISNMIWGLQPNDYEQGKEIFKNKSILKFFGAR